MFYVAPDCGALKFRFQQSELPRRYSIGGVKSLLNRNIAPTRGLQHGLGTEKRAGITKVVLNGSLILDSDAGNHYSDFSKNTTHI